jgi:hypothetical protein
MCAHCTRVLPLDRISVQTQRKVNWVTEERTNPQMQFPIKLLPLASFKFKHLEAVDDAEDVNNAYEESGTTGALWTPPEGANKQPNMVPQMIALPTVGFKILQGLGG